MTADLWLDLQTWWSDAALSEMLLSVVWVALGVATLVLLTMFVTGRGNVRHVKTSLMLSIMAHCGLALCTDRIEIATPIVQAKSDEPTFEIEQLIFDSLDDEEQIADPDTAPWEKSADLPMPEPDRISYEDVTQEIAEVERETVEQPTPESAALPDVTEAPIEALEVPRAENQAEPNQRAAEATPEESSEETTESREDVAIPTPSVERRRQENQGLTKSELERENRRGRTDDPTTDLRESQRMEVVDGAPDPSSDLKRGENSEAAEKREADAAETLPADDPGSRTAQRREEVGRGLPSPRGFSRRRVGETSPLNPNLEDDVDRSALPETPETDSDTHISARDRGPQPLSPDTELRPERDDSPRPGGTREIARLPATYQLRSSDTREKVALRHGATTASEEAVEKSLKWLAAHQSVEGYWDADGFMANCPEGVEDCWGSSGRKPHQGSDRDDVPHSGLEGDSGLTGLAVLAFLGAGYTHEEGQYADQVDHALRWLIRQQAEDGFLGGGATHYARMYCHGMASIALGEAYGMTQDPTLREPLQKAIDYIIERQNPRDGGWRYTVGKLGDVSMFGWQLMALKSAETAGLEFPNENRRLTINFLVSHSRGPDKGLAAYRRNEKVTPAMTAEALFCKQVLGIKRDNRQSVAAVDYLMDHLPKQSEQNLYYWYYGTLAMFQYGGPEWDQWNERVRETLVETQRKDGHAEGSWDPRPPWGDYGGRIYSTVLSTLCLEVYYRFLPMYRAPDRQ